MQEYKVQIIIELIVQKNIKLIHHLLKRLIHLKRGRVIFFSMKKRLNMSF